ncbi:Zn-dependent hydrolase [Jiella marina]|uniref:Zn-dependent hydrolase n=1 Tax=Jiella sp. LLJ827 TaxID=2917712 RepID=UPI0021010DB4|nr:Zn-dependent hydrolase [Jiella sp. LLJ827]MCQ0989702.1 Zn-dependent hydrolase [Jiella sp. LLJ827]
MTAPIRIDADRLRSILDGINGFGRNAATRGFDRVGFSDADMAVRRWFAARMAEEGLATRTDGAANVWGRFGPSEGPAIVAGSHLDTVPNGGAFDGALGVAAAFEAVLSMRDAGLVPKRAVEIVATAEEEGRFGGMLGSQAIAGLVTREWLESARDADDVRLWEAMAAQSLDPLAALDARRAPEEIAAFLELHIEQGPILEREGIAIGLAHTVSGMASLSGRFRGHANHSGTTPMDLRADAFAGLAAFAQEIPTLIARQGTAESRITIGKVELQPNFPHTIPGEAAFTVIVRDTDAAVMHRLVAGLQKPAGKSAADHDLGFDLDVTTWLDPVGLDPALFQDLTAIAERTGTPHRPMPSGAGHDAQTMQSLCPSALIFVPSRGGVSHAPEEFTEWSAIVTGANLLAEAVAELALR